MDSKVQSKSEKSIYERSIKIASNIIRESSFSLANRTLGTTGKPARDSSRSGREIAIDEPLLSEVSPGRRRLPNPTYIKVHHESPQTKPTKEDSVDREASAYIQRIRKQITKAK